MKLSKKVKKCCRKIWRLGKKSYLCTPFENGVAVKAESSLKDWRLKIKIEKFLRKNLEIKK